MYLVLGRKSNNTKEFCTFATCSLHMGMTGFDCKINWIISMSSHEIDLVKRDFKAINGEDNYALAA